MQLTKRAIPKPFAVLALCFMTAAAVSAAPVNCGAPPPPSQIVDTFPTAGPSSYSFTCGGLTFNNFEVVDAGTTLPAIMNLVSAVHDAALNMVVLNFNPNMFALPSTVQDIHFYFDVTGGIDGIDLAVGGTNSYIHERACSSVVDRNAGNTCTGGLPNQLAVLGNFSGNSNTFASFPGGSASPVHIFKDILVDGRRGQNGADLTSFSQSFHTVPEPGTYALMGAGLIGLVAWRRRAQA